ncbi:MAG: DUF2304 domain-containing protein [Vicinamibacterales bacterium]
MANLLQVGAVLVSGSLLLLVIDLVRRRKLTEEYSIIWILCAAALLVLSLWRDILHVTARWLGVYYPPAVLLLVLIFFVFVASLYFSVVISGQRRQIENLVEEIALLDQRLREAEGKEKAGPGGAGSGVRLPGHRRVPRAHDESGSGSRH